LLAAIRQKASNFKQLIIVPPLKIVLASGSFGIL